MKTINRYPSKILVPLLLALVLAVGCTSSSAPTQPDVPSEESVSAPADPVEDPTPTPEQVDDTEHADPALNTMQPPMSGPFAPAPEGIPTLIFYNGDVVTMDSTAPSAQAVAIVSEQIQAAGSDEEILALAGADTLTVDLQGRALLPGFVNPHTHILNDAHLIGADLLGAQQIALENGVTTLANMYSAQDFVAELMELDRSGALLVRTSLYLNVVDNCGEPTGDWWREYAPTDEPGERLRIAGIKLFTDGGSCRGPAFSYEHPFFGYGDLFHTDDALDAMISEFDAAGYQLAIHGLGDRAIEQILNSLETVLDGETNSLRHRLEHNAILRPDLLPRYSQIGVVPLIFGSYSPCGIDPTPPPEGYWEWPWRVLLDANPGLIVAWHADDPLVGSSSPLQNLYSMTTPFEVDRGGVTVCDTPEWMEPDKTITVEEALPMMNINAAYALFREDEVGSITPGKFADLVVLSTNPLAIEPEEIIDVEVWMTMIGGETLFCMPGQEVFCP